MTCGVQQTGKIVKAGMATVRVHGGQGQSGRAWAGTGTSCRSQDRSESVGLGNGLGAHRQGAREVTTASGKGLDKGPAHTGKALGG